MNHGQTMVCGECNSTFEIRVGTTPRHCPYCGARAEDDAIRRV